MQGHDELTPAESRVLASFLAGDVADLRVGHDVDLTGIAVAGSARGTSDRLIRAQFLHRLLLEHATTRGELAVVGGWIQGDLDVSRHALMPLLTFSGCWWDGDITGEESTFSRLSIGHSVIRGGLRLRGAKFASGLTISGARVLPRHGPALDLTRVDVSGDVTLRDLTIATRESSAVDASHAKIDGALSVTGQLTSTGTGVDTVRLADIDVRGTLLVQGGITAEHGAALAVTNSQISGELWLEGLTALSSTSTAIITTGTHIGRGLMLRGATLHAATRGLEAEHVTVGRSVDATGLSATSDDLEAVWLLHTKVGGSLILDSAVILSREGTALAMAHTRVGARFSLTRSRISGLRTAARISSLDVAESVDAVGLQVRSIRGTALEVTRAKIAGDLELADLLADTRDGPALVLRAGRVGGDLHLQRMTVRRDNSPAADGPARPYAVGLRSVTIDGRLLVDRLPGQGSSPQERWDIRDVTYTGNPFGPTATGPPVAKGPRDRAPADGPVADHATSAHEVGALKTFLRYGTTEYVAQAYRFVAGQALAAGHRGEAQRLLIAQRRHQLARKSDGGPGAGFFSRSWGVISRFTVGYGYRPWYALIWLLFTFAAAGTLATVLGEGELGVLAAEPDPTEDPEPCAPGQHWILAARMSIPLLSAVTEQACVPLTVPAEAVAHAVQLIGWAFTTLFIAGFTGIIRRD